MIDFDKIPTSVFDEHNRIYGENSNGINFAIWIKTTYGGEMKLSNDPWIDGLVFPNRHDELLFKLKFGV